VFSGISSFGVDIRIQIHYRFSTFSEYWQVGPFS